MAYFADPLGVDTSLVPVGITFPSAKETDEEEEAAAANGAADGLGPYHTCQILTLAEYSWFDKHLCYLTRRGSR